MRPEKFASYRNGFRAIILKTVMVAPEIEFLVGLFV